MALDWPSHITRDNIGIPMIDLLSLCPYLGKLSQIYCIQECEMLDCEPGSKVFGDSPGITQTIYRFYLRPVLGLFLNCITQRKRDDFR